MFRPPSKADRLLIRYLHGELTAVDVQRLRAELDRDPSLQARLDELERLWQVLQPAPPTPAPFFVSRMQRLADERRAAGSAPAFGVFSPRSATPPWASAVAAAALVAGLALGVGLGHLPQIMGGATERSAGPAPVVSGGDGAPVDSPAAAVPAPAPLAAVAAPATTPEVSPAPPSTPGASERQASPTTTVAPSATDATEAMGDSSLASGTTLAEEYWQALEGVATEGGAAASTTP